LSRPADAALFFVTSGGRNLSSEGGLGSKGGDPALRVRPPFRETDRFLEDCEREESQPSDS